MTTRRIHQAIAVATNLCLAAAVAAATWHVDDDNCPDPGDGSACNPFCTIQDAVAVAIDGDTILVRDGDYYGPINLSSKNLLLRSVNGAATTFLRGDQLGFDASTLEIDGGQDASTVIRGFTLTGAVERRNKAMTIVQSDPTLENCVVADNATPTESQGPGIGGAIIIQDASPTFTDCLIARNTAGQAAGAIHIMGGNQALPSEVVFRCCTFEHNRVTQSPQTALGNVGGAIWIENLDGHTEARFEGCLFQSNGGLASGRSVFIAGGGSEFVDCTIRNHSNAWQGFAAVYIKNNGPSSTTFEGCLFKNNGDSNARNTTCLAVYPHFSGYGTPVVVRRCRFENNRGGTAVYAADRIVIVGSQFINNTSDTSVFGDNGSVTAALNLNISHSSNEGWVYNCLFHGNTGGNYHGAGAVSSAGAQFQNCLFVDNHNTFSDEAPSGVMHLSYSVLRSCTFYNNTSPNAPYVLSQNVGSNVHNSIIWGGVPGEQVLGVSDVRYCDIAGGYSSGVNVITSDPMFVDPDGPDDDLSTWEDNDFSLMPGSPCIDSGWSASFARDRHDIDEDGDVDERIPIDYAGNPRRIDDPSKADCEPFGSGNCGDAPLPDMGAFEGPPGNPLIIDPVSGNGCAPFVSIDSDGDGVPDDADVCEGFDDCLDANGDGVPDGCDNQQPTADAGTDQTANEGDEVTLDGSGSSDPDNDALTYEWTQVGGPEVTLDTTDPVHPTFIAPPVPVGGATLTFQLVVHDGQAASEPATVNVTVKNVNSAPVASAGDDQTVAEGAEVSLSATDSYDPDNDLLTYSWVQTTGTEVDLTGADTATPTFTAPLVGFGGETLTFEVTVSDGTASATATVNVTVENVNHDPVARAGADQTRDEGTLITLDATGSDDPDGDSLTYAWVQTGGPTVTLSDPTSPTPTFTAPSVVAMASETLSFELTVDDGYGGTATDEVVITVLDTNAPPACELAQPSETFLWPPNHKLVAVTITGVSDPEEGDVTITVLGVTQDEPLNGLGDGDTAPDAVIQGDTVLLRSERQGGGNGRVYRVHFEADDGEGGVCGGFVTVCVPHDKRGGANCVDDGQAHNSLAP